MLKIIKKIINKLLFPPVAYVGVSIFEVFRKKNIVKVADSYLDISGIKLPKITKFRMMLGISTYESDEAQAVLNFLPTKIDVIEIGAGIGYISSVIDKNIQTDTLQISLEPNRDIVENLKYAKNKNKCNFTIVNRAYHSQYKRVKLRVTNNFCSSSLLERDKVQVYKQEIKAINLNGICNQYDIGKFSLVFDVEGQELDLLENELDLLEKQCCILIGEFHDFKGIGSKSRKILNNSSFYFLSKVDSTEIWENRKFNIDLSL